MVLSKSHSHSDTLSIDGHTLTVDEIPPHTHTYSNQTSTNNTGSGGSYPSNNTIQTTSSTGGGLSHTHGLSGGVQSVQSLPPFKAAYIWYRSA